MNKLVDLYMSDIIDKKKYTLEYNVLNEQLNKVLEEEKEEEKINNTNQLKSFLEKDFIGTYDKLSDAEKNAFWKNIIDYIKISERDLNKIEIKFL